MEPTLGETYLRSALARIRYYKDLAEKTFAQLEEKDLFHQPNAQSNSIAIIIQHMSGNMLSRFTDFLTADGEKAWRNRDREFDPDPQYSTRGELLAYWEKGWACMLDAIGALREEDLLKTVYIRAEPLSVIDAINRQLAHHPHHVGQIVYIGKLIRNDSWRSLSIPRGASDQFNQQMQAKS
jgi:hypothetical protein